MQPDPELPVTQPERYPDAICRAGTKEALEEERVGAGEDDRVSLRVSFQVTQRRHLTPVAIRR